MAIQKDPSDDLLALTISRAGNFLRGLMRPDVRAALLAVGFNSEEYQKGWRLYNAVTGLPEEIDFESSTPAEDPILALFKTLDAWDNTNLPIISAILLEADIEVYTYFDEALTPKEGAESITVIRKLCELERALRNKEVKGREARYEEDLLALEELKKQGYGAETFEDLREKITRLQTTDIGPDEAVTTSPSPELPSIDELHPKRVALYFWYEKWVLILQKRGFPRKFLRFLGLLPQGRPSKATAKPKPEPTQTTDSKEVD